MNLTSGLSGAIKSARHSQLEGLEKAQYAGAECAQAQTSETPRQVHLHGLGDATFTLIDAVGTLLMRLDPVLRSPGPEARRDSADSIPTPPSQLCEALFEVEMRLRSMTGNVTSALARLTL